MKGSEMPDKKYYKEPFKEYNYDYDFWHSSLQLCEISEREWSKLHQELYNRKQYSDYSTPPIDITDIVEDNNGVITFKEKKPTWICNECETKHEFNDLKQADNGIDYSYYCKNCGDVIESNGVYYGKTNPQKQD